MSFRSLSRVVNAHKLHQRCSAALTAATAQTSVMARFSSSVNNPADAVLSGANAAFVEQTFRNWSADPASVHSSWATYFATGAYTAPPSLIAGAKSPVAGSVVGASAPAAAGAAGGVDVKLIKVLELIRAYQAHGHAIAKIDPLDRLPQRGNYPSLSLAYHGLSDADLDAVFNLALYPDATGFLAPSAGPQTLRQIITRLQVRLCC